MGRLRSALVTVIVIGTGALLGACGGEQETQAGSAATAEPSAGCTNQQSIARVKGFADALRTADLDALERYWGDRFKWFSVTIGHSNGSREHFVAYSPRKARRYIREQDGLPIRLTEIKVLDKYQGKRGVAIEGRWLSGKKIFGKTEFICSSPQVRVWSMGVNPPGPLQSR